uniref:GST N-terminal domain-containing protein n=1 Tax=Acrobeloides nanus TaxID=290746 RepID=A0A914EG76_9BILA
MTTKYKLYYLDFEGRGEPIRLLLHYAGVSFEDFRINFQDWKDTWKAKMPFGSVPVLEIDGVMLPESHAIGRYLAKKFGLVGGDDLEAAQIDALLSHFEEFFKESIQPMLAIMAGFKEGDKGDGQVVQGVARPIWQVELAGSIPLGQKF